MAEVHSSAEGEGDKVEAPLFPHLRAWEEQRRVLDNLMAELASRVEEILTAPVSTSSLASKRTVSVRKQSWSAETLQRWPGSAIIIDSEAALWYDAIVKKISLVGRHEETLTRSLRFAMTEVLAPHFSYNPLKLLPRFTQDKLADFTEMASLLVSDASEKGKATERMLLTVLVRYLEDTTEPSLKGLAQFVGEPSFYSGMQLISYLYNIYDYNIYDEERPGHRFSREIAEEFEKIDNEDFIEEIFERVRSVLWPFTTPLGDRTLGHDFQLADFCGLREPMMLYITFPRHDIERLAPFLRLLYTQFAHSLRDMTIHRSLLMAFTGASVVQVSSCE